MQNVWVSRVDPRRKILVPVPVSGTLNTHTHTHSIPEGSLCRQACSKRSITGFHWDNNCDFLRIDLHHLTSVTLHMGVCVFWLTE